MTEKKWIQDLKIEYVNLTKGEKKVAEYLMDREDEIEHMTLRQCAEGGADRAADSGKSAQASGI